MKKLALPLKKLALPLFVALLMAWGHIASAQVAVSIANASSTGTTLNALAKLIGAPSTAVIAATTDTSGIVGVVANGAGTTGNVLIVRSGVASCVFDGATTAGDYVQISSSTGGDCHDTGTSTYPSSGQVIGRVLSTNGSGGTFSMTVAGAEIQGVAAGCAVSGSAGVVSNNGSNACTTDTNATLSAGALSLGASGTAGSLVLGNVTSGTVTIAPVAGALGSVIANVPANSGIVAELNLAQTWGAGQSTTPVTATSSSNLIATNLALGNAFQITLAQNNTLSNPTNIQVGWYAWTFTQDGTGTRTMAYGTDFNFTGGTAPTLTTAAGSIDVLSCFAFTTAKLACQLLANVSP